MGAAAEVVAALLPKKMILHAVAITRKTAHATNRIIHEKHLSFPHFT